jgi:hypothetical protein
MRIKCLACDSLARPVYFCAAQSPNLIDVDLFELGLHNTPKRLRKTLQERIDEIDESQYDAIVMAYGLCGQATVGLTARGLPIVVPRAHDCITLFLGSRSRYQDEFTNQPGTYWYALDYIERREDAGVTLGAVSDIDITDQYEGFVEKFGKDNADYLMEVMGTWQSHYQRAVYIDMGVGDGSAVEALAKGQAQQHGWKFQQMTGNLILVHKLLDGIWDEDYLVLKPGEELTMSYDENVIGCAYATGANGP